MEFTPLPHYIMTSVAVVFFPLTVQWEGNTYDIIVLFVDRHSFWVVAVPCLNKGLTDSWVARAMLNNKEYSWVTSVIKVIRSHNV